MVDGRVSALHSLVAGLISRGRDHGIHCWRELIRSKQLSSVSVCRAQVFAVFSRRGNSIHNLIPLLKKSKCTLRVLFLYSFKYWYLINLMNTFPLFASPIGCGCGIYWLHLCRRVRSPNECPRYNTKQSDGKVPIMLGLRGIWIPLHCHHFQVHFGSEWSHLIGSYQWVKKN